jgi:hypothetical protein
MKKVLTILSIVLLASTSTFAQKYFSRTGHVNFFYDTKLGSGLRKNLVLNFIQNRSVKLLGYYEGLSLIPYFRDSNNKNLFIETNLNRDSDKTGVFCSYNIDLVETDGLNNIIDLVGHTIAAKNETAINFLSYQANISEEMEFGVKPLDLPGNVNSNLAGLTYSDATNNGSLNSDFRTISYREHTYVIPYVSKSQISNKNHFYGFDGTNANAPLNPFSATFSGVQTSNYTNRTSWFSEGSCWGVRYDGFSFDNTIVSEGVYMTASVLTIKYSVHESAYVVIDGQYKIVNLNTAPTNSFKPLDFNLNVNDYVASSATQSFLAGVYFDNESSEIKISNPLTPSNGNLSLPGVGAKDIVLNTFKFKIKKDSNGVNKFVDFSSWNISRDSNDNVVSTRLGPIYRPYNGIWYIVVTNGKSFTSNFATHWLNNGTNTYKYEYNGIVPTLISSPGSSAPAGTEVGEGVHVDTSFLGISNLNTNSLIHDDTSFIQTFYKNSKDKKYLFGDSEAVIGAVGNIEFTGGSNAP